MESKIKIEIITTKSIEDIENILCDLDKLTQKKLNALPINHVEVLK